MIAHDTTLKECKLSNKNVRNDNATKLTTSSKNHNRKPNLCIHILVSQMCECFCFHSSIAIDAFPWNRHKSAHFLYIPENANVMLICFLILAHAPHQKPLRTEILVEHFYDCVVYTHGF